MLHSTVKMKSKLLKNNHKFMLQQQPTNEYHINVSFFHVDRDAPYIMEL